MQSSFLPSAVGQLTEPTSVHLIQSINRVPIATALSRQPIATAYTQAGEHGIPILLLHGFDSSLLEFRRLLPLLSVHNEVWAVDLLGFGFTDRPGDVAFGPAAIKTHLYQAWKTLIGRPVMLIGASMGGAAAIDFTLSYPQAVEKLVLVDSIGYTGPPPYIKFLFPPFDYLAVEYLRQRKLKALEISELTNPDPALLDLLRCSVLHCEMPNWHDSMIAFTKSGGYNFLANRIRQVTQPTLILWGESDDVLGTEDAQKFQQDMANSQLVWIRSCGHAPQLEQPEATAWHILAFR